MDGSDQACRQDTRLYRYEPITEPYHFRVLTLNPSPEYSSEIICYLHIKPLTPGLKAEQGYEAVSYTWDHDGNPSHVLVDGCRLGISGTVEAFLRCRREKAKPISLWIDSVCINQADVSEKNSQVPLMSLIYAGTYQLNIWLGASADESDLAMDELCRLGAGATPFDKIYILEPRIVQAINVLFSRRYWTRVWIIQEILWGSNGTKIWKARVFCGEKSITWANLIIATARMLVYKEFHRYFPPKVHGILALDFSRHRLPTHMERFQKATPHKLLALVASFRHFQSTDLRDKLYGLFGLLFDEHLSPFKQFPVEYSESFPPEATYIAFAQFMLVKSGDLDVLRHCRGTSIESLPSWVPDWSYCPLETPLPSSGTGSPSNYPWWFSARRRADRRIEFTHHQGLIRKHVEDTLDSSKRIRMNKISRRFMNAASLELGSTLKELLDDKELIVASIYEEDDIDFDNDTEITINEVGNRTVIALESHICRTFFREYQLSMENPEVRYRASGTTKQNFTIEGNGTLTVQGLLWDSILTLHEPFPNGLESGQGNSTHFMLAVARCKCMAMSDSLHPNPYTTKEARDVSFWVTLFAGQESSAKTKYTNWLPRVPSFWTESLPPVTSIYPGQVRLWEMSKAIDSVCQSNGSTTYASKTDDFSEWSPEMIESNKSDFYKLASLWKSQPYDLYHRPFNLPTVVPDPLWDSRLRFDKRAIENCRGRVDKWRDSSGTVNDPKKVLEQIKEVLRSEASLIPEDTERPGIEKYALGRRFFITKKGYFGLGPRDAKEGDRVAVLSGVEVPFVLRRHPLDGFEVIGETYVHGIMDGEVIEKWKLGLVDARKIVLR